MLLALLTLLSACCNTSAAYQAVLGDPAATHRLLAVQTGPLASDNSQAALGRMDSHPSRTRMFTPTNYSVVQNYFHQSFPGFDDPDFDPLESSFGLIDDSPSRWEKFRAQIKSLNERDDAHTAYKVFFLARHGQGFHNVAEQTYGKEAWDDYWSRQNGDGHIAWGPDALLTKTGERQAERNAKAWDREAEYGAPLPQRLYSSPLSRAMSTLEITWWDLLINQGEVPIVKENLREVFGVHTCDKRRSKSYIERQFPSFDFEPGFRKHDELWTAEERESDPEVTARLRDVLDELFELDPSTYISITAHGGTISAFLRACSHPNPRLHVETGSMVPVVVKAVNKYPKETTRSWADGERIAAPRGAALTETTLTEQMRRVQV
ncbi:hypothetical protein JCM3770_002619 [Rhodotorula araucariae]